jgi:hypothetical protein
MRKLSTLSLLLSFLACSLLLPAQQDSFERQCGTPPEISPWLAFFQTNQAAFPRSSDPYYVPLAIHLVGTTNGEGHLPFHQALEAFCALNEDFEQADIQFYLNGAVRYINSDQYYSHSYSGGIEMMGRHNVPNAINCYIVDNAAGYCGYAFHTLGIVLNKHCLEPGSHTWAHEMGHFLSLPHTFHGWESANHAYHQPAPQQINGRQVEHADGSNCRQAGDGFCDTGADYLNARWACQPTGLSQQVQHDPMGRAFRSEGSLLMSYAQDACANRFSEEQIAAMRANLQTQRPNLLANQPQPRLLLEQLTGPVEPAQGTLISNVSSLSLRWPAVAAAEGYLIAVNMIAPDGTGGEMPFAVYHAPSNSLEIEGLLSERSWHWRVKPYNRFDGCAAYSEPFIFDTGLFLSNTQEQTTFGGFMLHPNPQQAGQPVIVQFELPFAFNLHLSLYAADGRRLRQQSLIGHYGYNEAAFPTTGLPAGLYWLGIEHAGGRKFQKIVLR